MNCMGNGRTIFKKSLFLFLLIFFKSTLFAKELPEEIVRISANDTVYELTPDDIKKGERLFYGLIPLGANVQSCVSCHNVKNIDTLNWNPSALDIAATNYNKTFDEFKNVLLTPNGKKLSQSHLGYKLNDFQIASIKGYLLKFYDAGGTEKKPVIDKLLMFLGFLALFGLAVTDLLITKKIKFKIVHLFVILGTLFFITKIIVVESISLGRQENYQPLQPVKFSHLVHVMQNEIDCYYCHHTAEYSKTASIPSVNVCWNCHSIVREGTRSGRFEINKIVAAYENTKKPIEWVKIHNLPDHVFFSHAQHVGAGKIDCAECHGPVKEMDVVYQFSDLSMGWCLDCHRTRKVQFMENDYYETYKIFHDQIKSGKMDSVLVEQIGGTDCQRCHY